jgi:calcium-dependent protein kinase
MGNESVKIKTSKTIKPSEHHSSQQPSKKSSSSKSLPSTSISLLSETLKSTSFSRDIRKIYKFKDVIGGGHYGSVRIGYKKDELPKKYYAIKSICLKSVKECDLQDLFHEVAIISQLRHPNIIKLFETYYDESYFHLVMEYCQGKDVFEKIIEHGHITEKIVAAIIAKVIQAVSYCHSKGIIHRDLKPENILFLTDDINSEIKLIDFGLARKYDNNEKLSTVLGTPYYIAPEVLKGSYNNKCDIWSIGAMTYIMLSGDLPFDGSTSNEIFNKIVHNDISFTSDKWKIISHEAQDFIKECLIKDPEKRMTAKDAIKHKWFSKILEEVHSDKYLCSNILNNLRNFESSHMLKNIMLSYIVHNLNHQETAKLKQVFNAIDLDHTGHINVNELEKAFRNANINVTQQEIKEIITKVRGKSNDEHFEYAHFLYASVDQDKVVDKKRLEKMFKYFDINKDGYLDSDDLKQSFVRAGIQIPDMDNNIKAMIFEVSGNKNKIKFKDVCRMFGFI